MESVKVWQETVSIPTYETGPQDIHPMFLENRVYQGSSGVVYPYGVTDTLSDVKTLKNWRAVWLENDYIKVMILPELGGRVHRAWDKVKQRDFVYHNEVIKPALVGLLGPWISGGIEFNWPQHHRPTTYMPVDFTIEECDDGAKTVWVGETEPMHGLQVMTGFTLRPHRAALEIGSRVYNGNATPRHFLWWANPAVKGGDGHQSVFPPDVTAVFDHGKRAVSGFPIATGTYYKVDYSAGVDISRYKNVPVPTSYMAEKSEYDFVGAWSHDEDGGLLHVANHHIAPGKKQWSWGYSEFGQAWDRNLTDENGPYIELMTGIYADNQPDFTWLDAFEEKRFVQYFLPYHSLGMVQNASQDVVMKLERSEKGIEWGIYAISPLVGHCLTLHEEGNNTPLLEEGVDLSPGSVLRGTLKGIKAGRMTLRLSNERNKAILSYQEHQPAEVPLPEVAKAPLQAADITSVDEAWFIGQHLEQYHHASRSPFDYYLRGIELDPLDYRCNLALAELEYNRADYPRSKAYAAQALKRAHGLNKNPQCGQASLIRGSAFERQKSWQEAEEDFWRATWSGNSKAAAFYGLARLSTRKGQYEEGIEFCRQSLRATPGNQDVICLENLLLQLSGQSQRAKEERQAHLKEYPLNPTLWWLKAYSDGGDAALDPWRNLCGGRDINALLTAGQLLSWGMSDLAREVLQRLDLQRTLPLYLHASLLSKPERVELVARARSAFQSFVRFPNTLDEVAALENIDECYFAQHLLACFHYSKRSYQKAVALWQRCIEMQPDFADAWRGLAIHAWNKQRNLQLAVRYLDNACRLQPEDSRLLFERDLLDKLTGAAPEIRLARLEASLSCALGRDDMTAELLSLWHQCGNANEAAKVLATRKFHPWEGGEGKVTGQFILNHLLRGWELIERQQPEQAAEVLNGALHYPENLSEGRLSGQTDNDIWFWLGVCARQSGQQVEADRYLRKAAQGDRSINVHSYYNDQPVEYLFWQGMALRLLGQKTAADELFGNMRKWTENMKFAEVEADFFAVSQPDLLAFYGDLQRQQSEKCLLVEALAAAGMGDVSGYRTASAALEKLNPVWPGAPLMHRTFSFLQHLVH
jgi:tetratricopeptide (TPR) repeat protein